MQWNVQCYVYYFHNILSITQYNLKHSHVFLRNTISELPPHYEWLKTVQLTQNNSWRIQYQL